MDEAHRAKLVFISTYDEGGGKMPKKSPAAGEIVQRKYREIVNSWMNLHLMVLTGVVVVAILMECLLYFLLDSFNQIFVTPLVYAGRYILLPSGIDLLLLALAFAVRRSPRFSDAAKSAVISLTAAGTALVLYTVHHVFASMILVLLLPPLLTILYGNLRLTTVTSAFCLLGKLLCDFLLVWDSPIFTIPSNGLSIPDYLLCGLLLVLFDVISVLIVWLDRQRLDFSLSILLEKQQLQESAFTDSLTRVGNRRALRESLSKMEDQSQECWFFVMMDMDKFKSINDDLGHSWGDRFLRILGRLLLQHEDERFQPYRFGGDEFCAIIRNRTEEEAEGLCRLICREYVKAAKADGLTTVGFSSGATVAYPGESAQQILKRADAAMYRAKAQGGGSFLWERPTVSHEA